jgi:hypothetical protein
MRYNREVTTQTQARLACLTFRRLAMTRLPYRIQIAAAIAAMALSSATSARADVTNGNDWFRGANGAMTPQAQQMGGDFGPQNGPPPPQQQSSSRSRSSASDFPDDAVHDWVLASARWGYARAAFRRAEMDLDNVIRTAQLNFEQSTDYTQAVAEEKRAHDTFTAERNKALKDVVSDPKYLAALRLRDETGDQISRVRAENKDAVPANITLALASQKLRYASDAHSLEVAALENADSVKAAQTRLMQASSKVISLRQSFDNSVRNNPQILEARRTLEDTRLAVAGTEAYVNAAHDAAQLATDYSYFRHRWDGLASPVYAGGYGPNYGFGY